MGVLSGYATRMTVAQRTLYDRLRSQGIAEDIARQLAVAIEKSAPGPLNKAEADKPKQSVYHKAFAEEARKYLPPAIADKCHQMAVARSGGVASGESRRTMALQKSDWDEGKHPRSKNGEFGQEEQDKETAKRLFADHAQKAADAMGRKDFGKAAFHSRAMEHFRSKLSRVQKAAWDESAHSRDGAGRFSDGGGEIQPGRTVESAGMKTAYPSSAGGGATMAAHQHLAEAKSSIERGDKSANAGNFAQAAEHYATAQQHIFDANGQSHSRGNSVTGKSSRASKESIAEHREHDAIAKSHARASAEAMTRDDKAKSWLHRLAAGAHASYGGAVRRVSQAKLPNLSVVKHLCTQAIGLAKMNPLPSEFVTPSFNDEKLKPKRKKKKQRERVSFSLSSRILKAATKPWQKLVYSVVYAPDTVDLHGDGMDAATIEKAAHEAMRKGIYINHEHRGAPLGAHVVESYIAPCDMRIEGEAGQISQVRKGTWVMGMKIDDEATWNRVVDGTYRGFSLEGSGLAQSIAA